jgi:hypothetical protein
LRDSGYQDSFGVLVQKSFFPPKLRALRGKFFFFPVANSSFFCDYSSTIASVGQEPAQAPQLTHRAGSIKRFPSFSEIALTEHSLSQEPQFTQASVTL